MGEGIEVWRGIVAAWECDAMGHMNVRYYVAKCAEALVGLAAELGMPRAFTPGAPATLVVRDQHLRFMKEARPHATLTLTAGVVEMGDSDARLLFIMRHSDGRLAATFQTRVAHVTTSREATPFPWPERVRERARGMMVETPPEAASRSLDFEPVKTQAGLARALELGLERTGLGAISTAECDPFGRMRMEEVMGRVSDSAAALFKDGPPGSGHSGGRIGGATVEYRLLYFDWPRAGERVETRSGWAGADARSYRHIHWLLDPVSGNPWAAGAAVLVALDLDTRKFAIRSDAEVEEAKARAIPGLTL